MIWKLMSFLIAVVTGWASYVLFFDLRHSHICYFDGVYEGSLVLAKLFSFLVLITFGIVNVLLTIGRYDKPSGGCDEPEH